MIRRAFTMRLKPGGLEGYRDRHDTIWPELVQEILRLSTEFGILKSPRMKTNVPPEGM